jgi:dienelactone hydrolase/ketosteroid isomerase-like protein
MKSVTVAWLLACPVLAFAEIHRHGGSADALPHDKYVRVVSEADSPVQPTYVKTKDGVYVAVALRKPRGEGPFPALIAFHGAPGGRGMEQLVGWSQGATGGPVWERFLREGFVVAVADYRGGDWNTMNVPSTGPYATAIDDGLAVVDHVKGLPYVDPSRVSLYGVSLGGNLVSYLISKVPTIHAAVLGAPAPIWFLGVKPALKDGRPDLSAPTPDPALATANVAPIRTPVLILVGTEDGLLPLATALHDTLQQGGKSVRMDVYEHGYHDFVLGPQGQRRPDLPRGEVLLQGALDALDLSVAFVKAASPGLVTPSSGVAAQKSVPALPPAVGARDCGSSWTASPVDDAALRGVAQAWKDAYNGGDAPRVASLYAEDGQYLSAHIGARGREAIRAYFQRGIDAGGHIDDLTVLDGGSVGTLGYVAGTYAANNAGQKVDGRILLVLRRCGDAWLIVAHEVVVRDQP